MITSQQIAAVHKSDQARLLRPDWSPVLVGTMAFYCGSPARSNCKRLDETIRHQPSAEIDLLAGAA